MVPVTMSCWRAARRCLTGRVRRRYPSAGSPLTHGTTLFFRRSRARSSSGMLKRGFLQGAPLFPVEDVGDIFADGASGMGVERWEGYPARLGGQCRGRW